MIKTEWHLVCLINLVLITLFRLPAKFTPQGAFGRSITVLIGGTVLGQVIVILASPILSRIYTPEAFGLLAIFVAALSLLGSISSLRYELAIPIPEIDRDAIILTIVSLIAVSGMSVLFGLTVLMLGAYLAGVMNADPLIPYLWLLPIGYFLSGAYTLLNMWGIRNGQFRAIAHTKLLQSVMMVIVQVVGASAGAVGLMIGRVVGQASGIINLGGKALKQDIGVLRTVTWRELALLAYEHRRFPLVSTWVGLASSLGAALPPMFIASYFGLTTAGLYALTLRIMVAPMTMIGKSVGDVFYRQAPQAHREGRLDQLIKGVHARLVAIALPLSVVLCLSIQELFPILFGAQWVQAGSFAMWMTPWMFMQFTTTPATRVFPVLNRHWTAFCFQVSLVVVPLAAIFTSHNMSQDPVITIKAMSACYSIIYLARVLFTYQLAGGRKRDALTTFARFAPGAMLCSIPFAVWEFTVESESKLSNNGWPFICVLSLLCCAVVIRIHMRWLSKASTNNVLTEE